MHRKLIEELRPFVYCDEEKILIIAFLGEEPVHAHRASIVLRVDGKEYETATMMQEPITHKWEQSDIKKVIKPFVKMDLMLVYCQFMVTSKLKAATDISVVMFLDGQQSPVVKVPCPLP